MFPFVSKEYKSERSFLKNNNFVEVCLTCESPGSKSVRDRVNLFVVSPDIDLVEFSIYSCFERPNIFISVKNVVSSAKRLKLNLSEEYCMSLIYNRKRSGPEDRALGNTTGYCGTC